uniref:Ribosomal protein L2 n=1 Tax=Cyanophora paradoxa TaxID=2762 RepID=E9P1E2_CYAPA|nr:ribosomal protein L2 [Cyanophora paradoxa]ADW79194.1 ribosomal protein L2 [Cyanophora paradoxa]
MNNIKVVSKLLKSPCKLGIKKGGRNNTGVKTIQHRGGGHKKNYYIIDYKRHFKQISLIINKQYDPNRSTIIGTAYNYYGFLLNIILPNRTNIGDVIFNSDKILDSTLMIKNGNSNYIFNINPGLLVNNIELKINKGSQLVRSAGTYAQIMAHNKPLNNKYKTHIENIKNQKYTAIRLPSGEIRLVCSFSKATIGVLSNPDHKLKKIEKAGRSRWLNRRPMVRGIAMNPVDHPHGGRTNGGRPSVTPYSRITKGKPTVFFSKNKKYYILKKRI